MNGHLVGQAMGFGGVPSMVQLLNKNHYRLFLCHYNRLSLQEFHYKMQIYNTWRFLGFMNLNRS